jgi:hypothetical protein
MWLRRDFPTNMKMKDLVFSLSFIVPYWLQAVRQEWLQDPKSSQLIQQLQSNAPASPGYSWLHDEL